MLIRGYNNHGFEAWTIPALYMVGKYLRLFAIKSDAERSQLTDTVADNATIMQDDFDPESQKQSQLRDCEQQLKRIFTLCLNDRCVLYPNIAQFYVLTSQQSSFRGFTEMGHLLYRQPPLQNIL